MLHNSLFRRETRKRCEKKKTKAYSNSKTKNTNPIRKYKHSGFSFLSFPLTTSFAVSLCTIFFSFCSNPWSIWFVRNTILYVSAFISFFLIFGCFFPLILGLFLFSFSSSPLLFFLFVFVVVTLAPNRLKSNNNYCWGKSSKQPNGD